MIGRGGPLLGKETATNLEVLKIGIGIEVAAVHARSKNIGEILLRSRREARGSANKEDSFQS